MIFLRIGGENYYLRLVKELRRNYYLEKWIDNYLQVSELRDNSWFVKKTFLERNYSRGLISSKNYIT